jgi:hypothetical protein
MTRNYKMVPDDITGSYFMNGRFASRTYCARTATQSSNILCSTELWRIKPLLGNNSVNIFARKPANVTIGRSLLGNGSVNNKEDVFCVVRALV